MRHQPQSQDHTLVRMLTAGEVTVLTAFSSDTRFCSDITE